MSPPTLSICLLIQLIPVAPPRLLPMMAG